jgi:hypothetical protein
MKVKLEPGAELEMLTQGEVENAMTAALSGFSRPPQTDRDIATFTLDASGDSVIVGSATNVPVLVYRVKAGYDFSLHRLIVSADGYTAAVPWTNSNGGVSIFRNGLFVDGINLAAGMPIVFSYGGDAPVLSGNDELQVLVTGGPTSTAVTVTVQGTLETTVPQLVTS